MSKQEKFNPEFDEFYNVKEVNLYNLILHNDDVNTFEHVIDSLIEICHHDSIQAEQCAHIVHFKGKCDIKNGEFDELSQMKSQLDDRGLSVTID
jgi:ATP-dependent Clp protease adaptor protein ClpS